MVHASCSIDFWGNIEDKVPGADGPSALAKQGLQGGAGLAVEQLQSPYQPAAIETNHRNHVGGYAQGKQIKVNVELRGIQSCRLVGTAPEQEAHAAAGEVVMTKIAVGAKRVEHGKGIGQTVFGLVVVGDNNVDSERDGVVNLVKGFDAAV